jgi:amino acid adenylation domain-containing protein
VLLTEERLLGVVDPRGARVVCLDRDRERIASRPARPPDIKTDPAQPAYVIYTSGSTGQPKGVKIAHRSVANLIAHMRHQPGLTDHDVVANITTPAFDLSVPDWYLTLTTGARLAIIPREATADGVELGDWLARTGATFMQATPTTWQLLVDGGWAGSGQMKIVCGGEALPPGLVDELLRRGASLWHMYGPTETTVWSSILRLEHGGGPPPLGGPIANTRFYVVDGHGHPVPIGVPGELLIAGAGVALGYHERPQLTAEKFVPDPFRAPAGGLLYRTGDRVRWRPGGTLEFLGRIDHQVKLRGFRIELGEVEAVLASHPSVGAAAVVVREIGPGDQRLVAYLVAGESEPDHDELRRLVRTKLPPFMVPSAFATLESFPVNANGKLDRAALPLPTAAGSRAGSASAPPQTPVQEALAGIWREVLAIDQLGIDDDFFDLGGHSLLAVKMLARVQDALGVQLYLGNLFERSTIRELSELVMLELLSDASEDELASLLSE